MAGTRRKEVKNYLLGGCYQASMLGFLAIIAFFMGAFEITSAHLWDILVPVSALLIIDAVVQMLANDKLLANVFQWVEQNEEGEKPSMELTFKAQIEMLRFPLLGSGVSMGLWFVSGVLGVILIGLTSDTFSTRHLFTILISIISGGTVAMIFQYYFYKVIFHRKLPDLIAINTGVLEHREKYFRIDFRSKLMLSFLVLVLVSLIYSTIMGYHQATSGIHKRQTQLLIPIGRDVINMRGRGESAETINEHLKNFSNYLGQDIFIFGPSGEIIYGHAPKDVKPEDLDRFIVEYDSWFTKLLRLDSSLRSRNLPDSSDVLVWTPVDAELSIATVYTSKAMKSVLGSYNTALLLLIALAIVVAAWVARLAANDVSSPLGHTVEITEKIATGDLSSDMAVLSEDEMSDLASGLGTMINGLRALVARVGRSAEQVDVEAENIVDSQKAVSEGTNMQARVVEDSTLVARSMEEVVSDVSENVNIMAVNSEESIKVIVEMESLSREVSENISELSVSVESTTSAIYEMNATIREINENVEALSAASEETAASMLQMDRAIMEVEQRTKQTLDLSENVKIDATEGVKSVQSTIEGIGRVEEGVREAAVVINQLGRLAEEIGEIVSVINDIADQTNLLALNAAIIAAQAGERGRGFAVVADEIKKLSDRTTASTKQIRELISSVQRESQRAVDLMDRESQNVEEGVNIAFQAGQALEKIQRSAESSAEMVRFIAKATEEQANNSRRVTKSVESIAERVAQIASAINDQARGAEQITIAAGEMKEIAPVVRSKAEKQVENGKQVTLAMNNISQMVNYVQKSQERQREQTGKIMQAMDQIKSVCQANVDAVARLDGTVRAISKQSGDLKEEIRRFTLPQEDIDLEFDDEE